ncbi:DNA recombination protein RmuC [Wenxinia marina]|uniref:DNA recombination protein RmuC homolog n=1 Tax=Wenxinia marina DSM 24838 TaxID=1123501 RepID=A0A0D0QBM3_9RHOB|nr:DNA recombination protein RmuC [Wenxinia marina]KIQ69667.1 hypothetical protein Wenmar_02031 [Wenxinia marina DSM 24838]GGL60176.1 DNA recombination protein RmuC [Wenxinia marina]
MPPIPLAETLIADWQALPDHLRLAALVLMGLFLLTTLLWLSAARRGRSARAAGAEASRQAADLRSERDRLAERVEVRDGALARLDADAAGLRQGLQAAESARAGLQEAVTRLEADRERLAEERRTMADALRELQAAHASLQSEHAAFRADRDGKLAAAAEERQRLTELREEMSRRFEELANATLRRTGAEFSQAHTAKLTELLTPFREHVGRFETELRQVHKAADEERTRLSEQIRALTTQSEAVQSEAASLARALKGEKQKQGAWGEMLLERILEDSGLQRDIHYEVQAHRVGEDGSRYRPDVVVKMPRDKVLVVDSKVSLVAYDRAVQAECDEDRRPALTELVAAMKRHIDQLAAKGYDRLEQGSVDFVLMFVPIEGALAAALQTQGDLTSYAAARRIGIATPTTLMMALRTVDHLWTVERRESNAEEIAKRAGLLYDKVAGFVDSMKSVGDHLSRAVRSHDEAMGRLSTGNGNVLGQVEKLKAMGANASKSIGVAFDEADDDEPRLPDYHATAAE